METFKTQLKELSDFALALSGNKSEYTKEDLSNATLIFLEVFSSLTYDHHKDKLTDEQMGIIAEQAGDSVRQTILLFTGIDIFKIFKK